MTKLWHPLLKLNFWFSGRVMWPRVEHCRFERFRVERPAFSGRNNGTAFRLRLVHSRNCSIKLCTIYGISVSKLIMEWFFIKLLIKWTYSHACTCCDSEEINESSFESMRATSGRSATRSVRPEGVQGVSDSVCQFNVMHKGVIHIYRHGGLRFFRRNLKKNRDPPLSDEEKNHDPPYRIKKKIVTPPIRD